MTARSAMSSSSSSLSSSVSTSGSTGRSASSRSRRVRSAVGVAALPLDVPVEVSRARLAAAGKDLWIVGGGELAGQFLDAGLLDALIVTIAPVTLGAGAPLLPRRVATPPLELVSARAWGDVFVRLHYRVARPMG